MIKWLLVTALSVNLLALYWFSTKPAGEPDQKPGKEGWQDGLSGEIILLSELEVFSLERSPVVLDAVKTAEQGAITPAFSESSLETEVNRLRLSPGNELSEPVNNEPLKLDDPLLRAAGFESKANLKPESEPEKLCVELGRFDNEQEVNGLLEKLEQSVGINGEVKAVTEGLTRYIVYIPPYETLEKARQQQSVLKKAEIRSSLYYKGGLKNALSLGYFASSSNAVRRHKTLQVAGYEVALKTLTTEMLRYWIELDRAEVAKLSRRFWEDMAKEFPNVVRRDVECSLLQSSEMGKRAQ